MPPRNDLQRKVEKGRNNIPRSIPPAEVDERVAVAYKLLCRGLNRADILAFAAQNAWEETELAIDGYIEAAIAELAKAAAVDIDAELGKSIERLNHLYQNSVKVQDFKTALSIQKELNKVLQLKAAAQGIRTPQPVTQERPRLKIVGKK